MKKILAILLSTFILATMFTACGGKTPSPTSDNKTQGNTTSAASKETVTLKVWGSQEDQTMLATMVDEFKAANPDKNYDITFGVVSEADAKTRVLEDPAAAADVFAFANDQIKI